MENFLVAGRQLEGVTRGKMPFDDTDLYKIIEGAAYSLICKPNPALVQYLDSIIEIIAIGQEPDGYLTTWFTIDRTNPPAPWVKPSEQRWENVVSSHELYNSGHLFEAAAAHHLATGKTNFLDIALRNADLLVDNFGKNKLQTPPGHQIVETGLIKLYRITGKDDYLHLARDFLEMRGDSTRHTLYGSYSQDHLPVVEQEEAVGHAVRAVYMYAAMTDIATLYGDTTYLNAVNNIWNNIINKKFYITGGIGASREGEAFGENYELPNLTAYNETCAAIGNVYWNHRLFLLTGESKYYDVIERTLYNGLISGLSMDGTHFFYPNPLESNGQYNFNQGACQRSSWFDCSCCPTNLVRFVPSISGLVYSTEDSDLFVNLYTASKVTLDISDTKVEIAQITDYPWDGNIEINVDPEVPVQFTLKFRIPGWLQNSVTPGSLYQYQDSPSLSIGMVVNDKPVPFTVEHGYFGIERTWRKGDRVSLGFSMEVRRVIASDDVVENQGKVAFEYGPIVYCAEEMDNPALSSATISEGDLFTVQDTSLFSESIKILNRTGQSELTLVPYYLWANRGCNMMKVWLPME